MQIDVYDSYAQSRKGHIMHFDVFVEKGTSKDKAFEYGCLWLKEIDENVDGFEQSRCNYCHTELSNPDVNDLIHKNGYYILQMEGCPKPINSK